MSTRTEQIGSQQIESFNPDGKSGAKEREFLLSLSSMEDTFLRMQAKRQRQSTLREYFHYWVAVGEPSYKMRTALSPTSKND